ncbi:type IA DNA topoisomerase [uncultured Helicobacter sp.]|uniref:type IA DNA topoisomerase n=1 Tax=uncultured Helicobacter sp. TaxID=175537 RepID=UPI00374ECFC7
MPLIIIESPNKVAKIKSITGYDVIATIGHFMNLENINVEEGYKPNFVYDESKKKRIMDAIEKSKGQEVYIASDPDREGYAIGYMFYQKIKNVAKKVYRAEFHEITPSGIKQGLDNAKLFADTNFNYYQSFLARRVSDQLIGFILSPHLTRSLESKQMLSAGRVQTPALSLIVNREEEIKAFASLSDEEKKEYAVVATSPLDSTTITLKHIIDNKEVKYQTKQEAKAILEEIQGFDKALISKIEKTNTQTKPPKPFTTSKLLKVASKAMGISTKDIQALAQELFAAGLITYIRTDSEYISEEFLKEAEGFWRGVYPDTYQYTEYKAGKNSQAEAHEAIRITHPHRYEDIENVCKKENLKDDHIKLYRLIFKNTLLSQCKPATYEKLNVFLKIKMTDFKVSFKKIIDKGFLGVFDEKDEESEEEEIALFPYKEGDSLPISEILVKDINKNPPKRYLEADFIEVMEKAGIGRPSTYATFLPILLKKEYISISKDKKREIIPSALGISVINFFKKDKNAWLLDLNYTKEMEDSLDEIMEGKEQYIEYMKQTHSKMEFKPLKSEPKEKKDYPPSEAQMKFCKSIAEQLGIELPKGIEKDYRIASKFINDNKAKLPKKDKKGE